MTGIIIPEISDAFRELNYSKQVDAFYLKVFIIIVFAAMLGGYIGILIKRRKPVI